MMMLCPSFSVFALTLSLFPAVLATAPASYAVWAADSAIARGQGNGKSNGTPLVSYEHGEFWFALQQLYNTTGDKKYYNYILNSASALVNDQGKLISQYVLKDYTLDPVRTGPTFVYLYETTGAEKWRIAAETYIKQLDGQPRTAEGQYWHKLRYFNQGWLDGIYMGDVFHATYLKQFQPQNTTAWADVVKQFTLIYNNTLQHANALNAETGEVYTGLLYHGYDYSKTASWASDDRGHSPEVWIRALGWYMMALADMLEIAPAAYQPIFVKYLQDLAPKVIKAADPNSGVWWLVMSQPGRKGNYFESSGAVMFVYGILKGIRLGALEDADGSLLAGATKAYKYIVNNWVVDNGNGTMNWLNTVRVGSLDQDGSFEYYIGIQTVVNDLKGLAAFVLASKEYEKL